MDTGDQHAESQAGGESERRPGATGTEPGVASTLVRSLRRGFDSGFLAGVGGGYLVAGSLRALRRRRWRRGVSRLLLGGVLLTIGAAQRRAASRDAETRTVSPVSGDRSTTGGQSGGRPTDADEQASGGVERGASAAVDESRQVGAEAAERDVDQTAERDDGVAKADGDRVAERDDGQATESVPPDPQAQESATHERLGAAAFDKESARIPVPQRVFNQEYLSLNAEVYWGVRESDALVVLSGFYDAIQDHERSTYVASSEIDGDRMLRIPDRILDHWDEVAGGGIAVTGGDDVVVVATTDTTETDHLLVVVPDEWSDDVLEEA